MPKVSIIIPVFNCSNHMERLMRSIFNQTISDIEIIIIDDGSTDKTPEVIKELCAVDERIIAISQTHSGPGAARNKGIEIATGEYILFVDSDDEIEHRCLEIFTKLLDESGADLATCGVRNISDTKGKVSSMKVASRIDLISNGKMEFSPLDEKEYIIQISGAILINKFFRRVFLEKHNLRFAETYTNESLSIVILSLMWANRIIITGKELVIFHSEVEGALSSELDERFDGFIETIDSLNNEIIGMEELKIYYDSFLRYLAELTNSVFGRITDYKNFSSLYDYVKKNICNRMSHFDMGDYIRKPEYYSMSFIKDSSDSLEFALRLRTLKKLSIPLEVEHKVYLFPYDQILRGSNIVIYGAGEAGRDIYLQNLYTGWCDIIAWVDNIPESYEHRGLPIQPIDYMRDLEFETILVCINEEDDDDVYGDITDRIKKVVGNTKRIVYYRSSYSKRDLIKEYYRR